MVASISSLSVALAQLQSASSGGFDFSILASGSGAALANSAMSPKVALAQADQNKDKQIAQVAKDSQVQKDLARYAKVVAAAKTVDDVLADPIARKVFMKANGLGAYVDQIALAKKALKSDPSDPAALASKLSSVNGAWLQAATKYNFPLFGVTELKTTQEVKDVSDNYVAEIRLDNLDKQLPGLGSAVLFKTVAASYDTVVKILGSALGREVITTALGIPKQIAFQSIEAQVKAVAAKLDITKLKNPDYVDRLAQRYLIQLNGGTSGVTA
jgi:Protein of unknown function (DUF1217)